MLDQYSLQLQWQRQLADYVTAVAWSPTACQSGSAQSGAASSAAGEVVVWTGQELSYLQAATGYAIDCLNYSADGQFLAAGGQQGKLQIWQEHNLLVILDYPRRWIDHLAWHPTQPLLAFGTGKQVQIWDAMQQKMVATLDFPRSSVFDLAWQPQGDYLAIAGYQGVEVWRWASAESERLGVDTSVHALAWSEDGQYVAAATLDRQLSIARLGELEMPWVMRGFPSKIQQLDWWHNNLAVVSGGQLVWWNYADDDWQAVTTDNADLTHIAIHDDRSLLSMAGTTDLIIWDMSAMEKLTAGDWPHHACVALAWSPTGQQLAAGSDQGDLILFGLVNAHWLPDEADI